MDKIIDITTCKAVVDLARLRANATSLIAAARPARLMAVVKGDGYGHGAVRVTRALIEAGVELFAVATLPEAIELRSDGIHHRILVLGPLMPATEGLYVEHNLEATLGSSTAVHQALNSRALRVHLHVDTGMGRLGLSPQDAIEAARALMAASGVRLAGVSTHLSAADDDDLSCSRQQIATLDDTLKSIDTGGVEIHIANTEGLARLAPETTRYPKSLVRIGVALYGSALREDSKLHLGVESVMTLSARVTNIKRVSAGARISYNGRWTATRETTIATLGIGYADGYMRALSGKAYIGIAGDRYPVVGTVCMDMIMVDVGENTARIAVGDQAVLFGTGGPDVAEVAEWAGTISYEFLTGISKRVPRLYS